MPELIIKFACASADNRAEEFQHHLVSRRIINLRVGHEVRGSEVWLNFPSVQDNTINRIEEEARHWCLDRGLGLMQSSDESGRIKPVVLMIGDLAQMVD